MEISFDHERKEAVEEKRTKLEKAIKHAVELEEELEAIEKKKQKRQYIEDMGRLLNNSTQ